MTARRALASLSVAALAASLAPVVAGSAAAAPARETAVSLTPLGTYRTGTFDEGGAEIVAFDPRGERAFSVNAQAGTVDVIDLRDPADPVRAARLDAPGANSVAVARGVVAVAQQAADTTDPGSLVLYDARTLRKVRTLTVGGQRP